MNLEFKYNNEKKLINSILTALRVNKIIPSNTK